MQFLQKISKTASIIDYFCRNSVNRHYFDEDNVDLHYFNAKKCQKIELILTIFTKNFKNNAIFDNIV